MTTTSLLAAAALALVSGIFWLGFVAATMSGELSSLFDPYIVWLVVSTTDGSKPVTLGTDGVLSAIGAK